MSNSNPTQPEPRHRSIEETALSHEKFNQILCPNMRTGVRMSLLDPDKDGWVHEQEVRDYLEYIGLIANTRVEDLLISTGKSAPKKKKPFHINLTAFRDTFLDHGSASGILNTDSGFSEQRLEFLKSFADESGRLTKNSLGIALNNFHQCPVRFKSFGGTNILSFEFAGMLEIFGRDDRDVGRYFTTDDIDSLWRDNRFPEGWAPPAKTFYGSWGAFSKYLAFVLNRFRIGWWKILPSASRARDEKQKAKAPT